jgi:hypothetical protein
MCKHSMKFMMVGLATAAALAAVGCSRNVDQIAEGSAQISVHALSLAQDVARVDVAVSNTKITTPITMPLYLQSDGQFRGLINHITTDGSASTTFSAKAYDASGTAIYEGSAAGVTITKDQIADVQIVLTEKLANAGFANHAPSVDALTVSSTKVNYGDTVAYTITAHDIDLFDMPNNTKLTFDPSPSCGTFGAPTVTAKTISAGVDGVQWKAIWTAPASGTSCQLNMTITDTKGAKASAVVTIALGAAADNGGARINTVFESYPLITSVSASPDPAVPGQDVTVTMVSSMSDGEIPTYAWTSPDCGAHFENATVQSPVFHMPSTQTNPSTCTFAVVISGPVHTSTNSTTPSQLTTAGSILVNVGATQGTDLNSAGAPVIDLTSQSYESVGWGATALSHTSSLYVKAHAQGTATLVSFAWSLPSGSASGLSGQVQDASMGGSTILYTGSNPMAPSELVTVVVTDSNGSTVSTTITIISADNPCGAPNSDNVPCNDGSLCTTGDKCLGGLCVGTPTTCAALDQCHDVGSCVPSTGICSNPLKADGSTCVDGNGCTQTDTCVAGTCTGASPVVCSAQDQCHVVGTCAPSTGLCSNPAKADGASCDADASLCTPADSCQLGVCQPDTAHAVVCPAPAACHTLGVCVASTGHCTNPVAAAGSSCSDSNACTDPDTCDASGSCVGGSAVVCNASDACHIANQCNVLTGCAGQTAVSCDWGQVCSVPQNGACVDTCPAPIYGVTYAVPSVAGLAVDGTGMQYITASLTGTTDFGSGTVSSNGGGDVVFAKVDPASSPTKGKAVWTAVFGDSNDQFVTGGAVAHGANGVNVAAIGNFLGSMTVGTSAISNANTSPIDFIVAVNNSGAGLWAKKVDMQSGAFLSIAGNPAVPYFAICGYAQAQVGTFPVGHPELADLDNKLVGTAGGDGKEDIVIAKLDATTGVTLWARQIGGAGTQLCNSVAVASDGSVYAAGSYKGTLDFGNGALTTPTGTAIWAAKFNATTGAVGASDVVTFATTGTGVLMGLKSIAVSPTGAVAIAGNLRGTNVNFGSNLLTSLGGTDGFVAELNGALALQWVRFWGDSTNQEAHAVGFTSVGDVVVSGYMKGTVTGLSSSALVASGSSSDAYWAKFHGADGTSDCAGVYGDAATQSADVLAIANLVPVGGAQRDMISFGGVYSGDMNYSSKLGFPMSAAAASGFVIQLNP